MQLLMVAPPGAGKGTQAERLAAAYGIEHISSGELLRREIAAGSPTGRRAAAFVDAGDLVPDELLLDVVAARVLEASGGAGYVLDGYPRTLSQAEAAHALASQVDGVGLQAVLHLRVGRGELRRRLLGRAHREGRADDTEATIEHRLAVFDQETEPLLGYYAARGILHDLDGERPPDEVAGDIAALLVRLGLA